MLYMTTKKKSFYCITQCSLDSSAMSCESIGIGPEVLIQKLLICILIFIFASATVCQGYVQHCTNILYLRTSALKLDAFLYIVN